MSILTRSSHNFRTCFFDTKQQRCCEHSREKLRRPLPTRKTNTGFGNKTKIYKGIKVVVGSSDSELAGINLAKINYSGKAKKGNVFLALAIRSMTS
jgi:hypothetical protein